MSVLETVVCNIYKIFLKFIKMKRTGIFVLILMDFMTHDVMSVRMFPSGVKRSHDALPLDVAAAEAGRSHSRDNMTVKSLAIYDDDVTDLKSELLILLDNRTVQKIIVETQKTSKFKFEYQFNCPNNFTLFALRVDVPPVRTVRLKKGNEKIYINCRSFNSITDRADKVSYSDLVQKDNINVTLIGGLIGVSHVSFSVYSVNNDYIFNKKSKGMRVLGLQKLSRPLLGDVGIAQQLYETVSPEKLTLIETTSVDVLVVRTPKVVDTVFMALIFVMEVVQMIALGSMVELEDFKNVLRRPLATFAGLFCHYVAMTLLAYTVAKLLQPHYPLDAAGTFVDGLCPGSSTSNIYAYLLYGDLPLSLTITILSYFVAFAMIPLWTYTIGQEFFTGYDIVIPYMDLVIMLVVSLPPLIAGMFIRKKFPNYVGQIQNILTPIIILLAVGFFSTGIYASLYLFYLLDLKLTVIGCALSYTGYLLGGVIMLPFKRSRKTTITMTLEVGMKNTGFGFAFLINTMPHPIGDIASVVTASVEVASQIPPLIVSIFLVIWEFCRKKYKPVKQDETDGKENDPEENREETDSMVKHSDVNKSST